MANKSLFNGLRASLLGTVLALGATLAHAEVTVYTDRDEFLARLQAFTVDTFNDLSFGGGSGSLVGPHLVRSLGSYGFEVNGTFHGVSFGGSPTDVWLVDAPGPNPFSGLSVTITAGAPLALGGDFFSTEPLQSVTVNGVALQPGSTFIGFVSEDGIPLTQIGVSAFAFSGPRGNAAINNLVIGTVPEPAPALMLVAGLCWLARLRRVAREA